MILGQLILGQQDCQQPCVASEIIQIRSRYLALLNSPGVAEGFSLRLSLYKIVGYFFER